MSYLDTFKHEVVGSFTGLPVYHPLETVAAGPDPDMFACSPQHLVIGGGSGEHPALVVTRLDWTVGYFINSWMIHVTPADDPDMKQVEERLTKAGTSVAVWDKFLDSAHDAPPLRFLNFHGWSVPDYHAFYERCLSRAATSPFQPNGDEGFESWLASSVGEFVFFSRPDLFPACEQALPKSRLCVTETVYRNVLASAGA